MFGDLGYYTINDPVEQFDTWENPWPVAFPSEPEEPVPGWGMNLLLAGPAIIAVGDAAAPAIPGLPNLPGLPPLQIPDVGGVQLVTPAPVQGRNLQAFTSTAVQLLGPLLSAFDGRIEKSGQQVLIHVSKAQSLPGSLGAATLGLRTKGLGVLLPVDLVPRLTKIGGGQDDGSTLGYATDDLDAAAALGAGYAVFYQPANWRTYNVFQKHPLATLAGVGIVGVGIAIALKGKR